MANERIVHEIPRFSFEEGITMAYEAMVATRTILKTKLKSNKYTNVKAETQQFYSTFIFLFGLTAPKIDKDAKDKLRERISAWDSKFIIKMLHNNKPNGIEEGIDLSEEWQEVLRSSGVFK
jgi:hypothetical protein